MLLFVITENRKGDEINVIIVKEENEKRHVGHIVRTVTQTILIIYPDYIWVVLISCILEMTMNESWGGVELQKQYNVVNAKMPLSRSFYVTEDWC